MSIYISILRGINVSGQKCIKMDALRKSYERLGFCGVTTYLQSGNVIFADNHRKPHELATSIMQRIKQDFGFDIPVIVLSIDQLKLIIENNPFLKESDKDAGFLHVTFFTSEPQQTVFSAIENYKSNNEDVCFFDQAGGQAGVVNKDNS